MKNRRARRGAILIACASVACLPASRAAAQSLSGNSPAARQEVPPSPDSSEGRIAYTWRDGDRLRTAYLDTELVLAGREVALDGEEVVETSFGSIVRLAPESERAREIQASFSASRSGDGSSLDDGIGPVFRSRSGAIMALPGGVLLVVEGGWSRSRVNTFLAENGIEAGRVSPLGEIPNGFVISTDPGFASLDLANELAEANGVILSSPNWWRQLEAK